MNVLQYDLYFRISVFKGFLCSSFPYTFQFVEQFLYRGGKNHIILPSIYAIENIFHISVEHISITYLYVKSPTFYILMWFCGRLDTLILSTFKLNSHECVFIWNYLSDVSLWRIFMIFFSFHIPVCGTFVVA